MARAAGALWAGEGGLDYTGGSREPQKCLSKVVTWSDSCPVWRLGEAAGDPGGGASGGSTGTRRGGAILLSVGPLRSFSGQEALRLVPQPPLHSPQSWLPPNLLRAQNSHFICSQFVGQQFGVKSS